MPEVVGEIQTTESRRRPQPEEGPLALLYSDSELVVKQIDGRYRVKHPDMLPLHREASSLLRLFDEAVVSHVRREQNKDADRLANLAMDQGLGIRD